MPTPTLLHDDVARLLPLAALALAAALLLAACTTEKESSPARTATEQLLISAAADRAAANLDLKIPESTKVFVDSTNFEGIDSKYALGAIRTSLLRRGAALVSTRQQAEAVVEVRSGALSIDEDETLVGIRSFDIPIPLTGTLTTPEIALFKLTKRQGVAKFAATGYGAADGRLIDSTPPRFGYAANKDWLVLLFFSWRTSDLPSEEDMDLLDRL